MSTIQWIIVFLGSLIISLILGPIIIPALKRLKFGQSIREEGPQSHLKKAGIPTIGGIIFIISTCIVMIFAGLKWNDKGMVAVYALLAFGFIGFLDDILKILKKNSDGLLPWQKMILLIGFGSGLAYYEYNAIGNNIIINLLNIEIPLGIIYIPFMVLVYAATTNSVNLTDGLDGLCSSVSVLVLTFFTIVALYLKEYSLVIFCLALIGGLIGFLRFNFYPAKVIMGDTGSLAIGGAIASVAIMLKMPLILFVVGAVYVLESISVMLQVISFKLTGKRIFKMAPIHHHFELSGWSEIKIVTMFSIITTALCIVGFIIVIWI